MTLRHLIVAGIGLLSLVGCVPSDGSADATRAQDLPAMRWDHLPQAPEWTKAVMAAMTENGAELAATVPTDIDTFCPAYEDAGLADRRAFWAGLLSALAKHESTWNPGAKGGGGQWIGLLQIAPGTARAYDCDQSSAAGLTDGSANLACAVRIAAEQVARDGAIVSDGTQGGWRGIARDWAPMRKASKREDMATWTRQQSYCTL